MNRCHFMLKIRRKAPHKIIYGHAKMDFLLGLIYRSDISMKEKSSASSVTDPGFGPGGQKSFPRYC